MYACVGQLENIIILSIDYIMNFVLVLAPCTVYFNTLDLKIPFYG